jgi:hypothetical protein
MNIATVISLMALGTGGALPNQDVPSNPTEWDKDFLSMSEPSSACPGGSVEALRKHMTLSSPYGSAEALQAASLRALPQLSGVAPGDQYYSFSFRSELPGGTFWGFGGYLVTRGPCVVHAEVTNHDN